MSHRLLRSSLNLPFSPSSSDDYKFFMINSSSSQTLLQTPLLNQQHHNHPHDQPSPTHSRSYVSLHHPQQQNLLNNMMMTGDAPPASYHPTDCVEMSDVIAGPSEAGASTSDGQGEHYIYVTYPPELKRRLLERYATLPPRSSGELY